MRFIIRKEAPSWDCGRFYFSCEIFKSCLSLRDRFNLECHYRMMRTKKEHINSIKVSGLTCWRLPIKRKTWNRQFNAGRHKENWFGNCQNKDFFWLIWRNDIFFSRQILMILILRKQSSGVNWYDTKQEGFWVEARISSRSSLWRHDESLRLDYE